jgi:hypothetical protein
LKNNTHLLSPHVQLYIPQQFRDQKGRKLLMNKNEEKYRVQARRDDLVNINPQNFNVWPAFNPDSALTTATITTPVWNNEIRKMQDELVNLKKRTRKRS